MQETGQRMGEVTNYLALGLERPASAHGVRLRLADPAGRCGCMIPSGIERKSSALAATLEGAESS